MYIVVYRGENKNILICDIDYIVINSTADLVRSWLFAHKPFLAR